MLKYFPIIKRYAIQILPSLLIISAFYIFTKSDFDKKSKMEIKALRAENAKLSKINDSIFTEISIYEKDMDTQNEIIKTLFDQTETQQEELNKLKKDIKTIQKKYEQAKTHSDHFSSADIARYFSDL